MGTTGIVTSTETAEMLDNAKANIQQVAENPGVIRTWFEGMVPDILNFAFQVVIAFIVYMIGSKFIRFAVRMLRVSMEKKGTDEGVKQFLTQLVKYALYIVLVFTLMGLFGIATTSLVAVLGSAGVAVGLALQGSLSNLAGGVLILLLKPFRVGDYIIQNGSGNEGTVTEISIFYTKLMTGDNKVIMVPNGALSNGSLTNVSDEMTRRVDISVGISYDADIKTAKEVLFSVAQGDEARVPEQDAVVFVDSLGDSAVNMGVRIWVASENYWTAKWRLTENVKYALDDAKISIPYPQMDVKLK